MFGPAFHMKQISQSPLFQGSAPGRAVAGFGQHSFLTRLVSAGIARRAEYLTVSLQKFELDQLIIVRASVTRPI